MHKRHDLLLGILISSIVGSGCAHGFNREKLRNQLEQQTAYSIEVKKDDGPVTAEAIREARALRPQLRFPFSLAVYDAGGCGMSGGTRDSLVEAEESLRERGIVSQMYLLSSLVAKSDDLKSVRLAAAKHGADAVLYIRCLSDEDRYLNALSVFYLTILGYWAVPGSSVDALVMLQGAMWDVGNEYLYLTVEAEAEGSAWGPGATLEAKPARDRAKRKAIKAFSDELVKRLTGLRG